MIKRALARGDGTGLVLLDDGQLIAISPATQCQTSKDVVAALKSGSVASEPWTRAAELSLTHPHLSPLERLQLDKKRGLLISANAIETARSDIVGDPGQQSDRDRKADMALNALNSDPALSEIKKQALNFLAIPANELGVTPEALAKLIKEKRDRETAALMVIDAYRIKALDKVRSATTHDAIEAGLAELKQGIAKAMTMAK